MPSSTLKCEPAPLLLSRGDWGVLVTRPISAGLLIASALLLVSCPARPGRLRAIPLQTWTALP